MVNSTLGIAVIIAMALVTYGTRAAGLVIMSRIRVTKRAEAFLTALSGSVLVALIVPETIGGDWGAKGAVGVAILFVALTGQSSLAMVFGILAAVGIRFFL
ncbi:MAG: AzlD domain-containing protein [Alphaproteobacteria bacterium]|nr:AzlD domain-containing protein [Rhodospirillales bacterium]MCW9044725.1 AzlD domain-containing protein [Alphaproteobacteria bacterium]